MKPASSRFPAGRMRVLFCPEYFAAAGAEPVDFRIYFVYTFAQKAALTRRQTTMASNFEFYSPTRVIFGKGTEQRVGALVREYGGTRVLIVYGGKSAVRSGVLNRAEKSLAEAGISSWTLGGVVPNPHLDKVYEGIRIGKENSIDFLLAVGGGSVMDAAKAIAVVASNGGDYWDYIPCGTGKGKAVAETPLPIVAITTTAGTGSETDAGCVITNAETHEKTGFVHPGLFPVLAVVDPELMLTVPPKFTAFQGFDALFHSTEAYISNAANLMSDMYVLNAIENVARYLPRAVADGSDLEARTRVAWGNTLSGSVMCVGRCTSEHSLEHAMSAYHQELPHGAGLIMISKAYYAHFIERHVCDERFVAMARALGVEDAREPMDFIRALEALQRACGVADLRMSDYGISPDEFPAMVRNARETMGFLFPFDREPLSDEECEAIYRASYR